MTDPTISIDCYARPTSLSAPIDATLTTIQELVEDGTIDDCTIHSWPSTVVLSDETDHTDVVETFRTFEAWADQWGVSIEPPFSVETRTSQITGDRREVLVTPVLCVAISIEGALREVFPHQTEGRTYTVEDAITTLTKGTITVNSDLTAPIEAADDRCPWCEAPIVTGQGLYACSECDWIAIATGPGKRRQYRPESRPTDAQGVSQTISPSTR